jgi:hypothetical protein
MIRRLYLQALHADSEQVAELDLGNIVRDVLVVHQVRVRDVCGTRWSRDVRLIERLARELM